MSELQSTAMALVAPGKGILAADESTGTIGKRFSSINVANEEPNRRAYRQMLFTTTGFAEFISGVILYDETINQSSDQGVPFAEVLSAQGVIPGIKVDQGTKPLALSQGEVVTEGLDGLRERLVGYREQGARFAKWRAVINIGDDIPSQYCIDVNAQALARFAALCQQMQIVPIVEPEALMDGGHDIERCLEVTVRTLRSVFNELLNSGVELDGILLKPNMVLSGKDCPIQAPVEQVAEYTIRCFRQVVPAAVPGIVFLSGGQSDEVATANLNAMNRLGPQPWELSFSFGRALQAPALKAWKGEVSNLQAGQQAFYHRAKCNGAARSGSYTP